MNPEKKALLEQMTAYIRAMTPQQREQKQQQHLQRERQAQIAAAASAAASGATQGSAVPMSGVTTSAAPPVTDPGFAPMPMSGQAQQQPQATQDLLGNMADQL